MIRANFLNTVLLCMYIHKTDIVYKILYCHEMTKTSTTTNQMSMYGEKIHWIASSVIIIKPCPLHALQIHIYLVRSRKRNDDKTICIYTHYTISCFLIHILFPESVYDVRQVLGLSYLNYITIILNFHYEQEQLFFCVSESFQMLNLLVGALCAYIRALTKQLYP